MSHFQQRSELSCIWKGLLSQQSGDWTKPKPKREAERQVRLLLPRGNGDQNLRNGSRGRQIQDTF